MTHVLSWIIWLPIGVAVLLAFFPRSAAGAIKTVGLSASVVTFGISLMVAQLFADGR